MSELIEVLGISV